MQDDSRIKNSTRNIIYRVSAQFATILLKFISRTIFIKMLGAEYLGIEGLFSSVLQVLALSDLGLDTVMVFSMYKPLAEHDEKKLSALTTFYKNIYSIIALAVSVIGIALIPFLKYLINLDTDIPYIYVYYILYLASTVSSYLVVYKTCILKADQKNYIISRNDTIFSILTTILTTIFLFATHNYLVYLIVTVVITYAKNFYCSHLAVKLYPFINSKEYQLDKKEKRDIFETIRSAFIYKFSQTLSSSTDNLLISVMFGTIYVGYYSNYNMIINNVSLLTNMIFYSITPSIGNLITCGNKEKNFQVYKTMQFVSYCFSGIVIACVYILIDDFICLWIGAEYQMPHLFTIAVTLNLYLSTVLVPIWSYRDATGMYRRTKYVQLCTAIVNLVFSIVLGKWIGIAGVIFASSIARLTTYFWYEPKILFREFFAQNPIKYYLSVGYNVICTAACCIFARFLTNYIVAESWLMWILKALVSVGISALVIALFYIRDPEVKNVINYAKNLISRKVD